MRAIMQNMSKVRIFSVERGRIFQLMVLAKIGKVHNFEILFFGAGKNISETWSTVFLYYLLGVRFADTEKDRLHFMQGKRTGFTERPNFSERCHLCKILSHQCLTQLLDWVFCIWSDISLPMVIKPKATTRHCL